MNTRGPHYVAAMARSMVANLAERRNRENYGLYMWVSGQRAITGVDIQRSILLYMEAFDIREDQFDVLRQGYHNVRRDMAVAGVDVEKCKECPEKEPA